MHRLVLVGVLVAGCAGSVGASSTVPELTEQYGCGRGFYLGTLDQTAGLFLLTNLDMTDASTASGTFQLPGDEWTAELTFGQDLFVNWCDDVLEPGEPEAAVEETWSVEGVLHVVSLPPAAQCGEARARLQQAMAIAPDGRRMDLGVVDLVNETWGCFAG